MINKNLTYHRNISFWKKTALVVLGVFFTFLLLELGLRISGLVFLTLQEHRNMQSIKQKGAYRIMCLGESTTAIGGQDAYPAQLEDILNQRNIGVKFSLVNRGVVGTNTAAILFRVKEYLDRYKPDMVITMMGDNDRAISYYRNIPEANTGIFRYSSLYRLARFIFRHILDKLKSEGIYGVDNAADSKRKSKLSEAEIIADKKFFLKEEALKKTLASNPKDGQAYNELGVVYRQQGRMPEAKELFKKALAFNPENDQIYYELGVLYRQQGSLPEAEELFKKALVLNPKNDWAYIGLGILYQEQERFSEEEKLFKKALALNPKNSWLHAWLGMIYLHQDRFPESERLFKKALALNPESDLVYIGLGWLYQKQGRISEAEELFKKAIADNLKSYQAFIGLGMFYRQQGRFAEAEELFKKAIALNPEDDWNKERGYRALASLYREMHKTKLAQEYSRKVFNGYALLTINNYRKLKRILDKKGIRLVCAQYPMRSIAPLKDIFAGNPDVILVDNEQLFKEAVMRDGYMEYFRDMASGDFGHCTRKGNRLLAENIANLILKEVFGK